MATAARENSPGVAPIHGAKIRTVDGKAVFAPSDDDLHAMEDAIRAARKTADVVAVSFHIHWGPLEEIDATGKQLIAHAAIDAGADMILGHGPHVVNGIEFYKNKPIVYSMGNLAFQFPVAAYEFFPDSLKTVKRLLGDEKVFQAMAVRMTLSSRGRLKRMEILPLALSKEGDPRLTTGEVADKIFSRATSMSAPFGTTIKRQSWYGTVNLPQADGAR
jgi:poly-gamma-glutamate synthesis protein (capsule biosynthesis protein)